MKFLQAIFDKHRKDFEPGGKFERLYPLFEAKETFLFVTDNRTSRGTHIRDALDSKRLMSTVIAALIPVLLFGIYNAGYQYYMAAGGGEAVSEAGIGKVVYTGALHVLPIVITSYAVGGIWELLFAVVRKHEINEGFLVTGMLLPLTLPPDIPLWIVAVGVSFGVVIGKEVFGGTGMNVFNPALTARAFIFFAYPAVISGDGVWRILPGKESLVEGYSGATALLYAASHETGKPVVEALQSTGGHVDFSWMNMFVGFIPGSIGETSALLCVVGAVILIATGVGSWQIMVACVLGATAMGLTLNIYNSAFLQQEDHFTALPFYYHYVMGGFAFGTVYMATDPVSAAGTDVGKWIYGVLIGIVAMIVRVINPAYPEGIMLAILFMNAFAPTIDYFVVRQTINRRMQRAQAIQ